MHGVPSESSSVASSISMRVQIAFGILRIANANMAGAIRVVTTQRGIDPRTCVLIASGGAGPMHAAFLAQEIGISEVLIPPAPGNVSAFGTLVADMRYDYMRTFVHPVQELNKRMLSDAFEQLRAEALASLKDLSGSDLKELTFKHLADVRYIGQGFELTVPLPEFLRRCRRNLEAATRLDFPCGASCPIQVRRPWFTCRDRGIASDRLA